MTGIDLRLSLQRTLLGAIYPSIRAIGLGWDSENFALTLRVYFDRKAEEEDQENMDEVLAEVLADFPSSVRVPCFFYSDGLNQLRNDDILVYKRKE